MLFTNVFALAAVASVSAHGFISCTLIIIQERASRSPFFSSSAVQIGGKTYSGPFPFSNKNAPSPIRKITTTFPITSATDADMNCGKGAVKAAQVATAKPGDKVTLSWQSGQNKNVSADCSLSTPLLFVDRVISLFAVGTLAWTDYDLPCSGSRRSDRGQVRYQERQVFQD